MCYDFSVLYSNVGFLVYSLVYSLIYSLIAKTRFEQHYYSFKMNS